MLMVGLMVLGAVAFLATLILIFGASSERSDQNAQIERDRVARELTRSERREQRAIKLARQTQKSSTREIRRLRRDVKELLKFIRREGLVPPLITNGSPNSGDQTTNPSYETPRSDSPPSSSKNDDNNNNNNNDDDDNEDKNNNNNSPPPPPDEECTAKILDICIGTIPNDR